MVTDAQLKFFDQLLSEKDFGDQELATLKAKFARLDKRSASLWIDRAMQLPKVDVSGIELVPPIF